MLPFKVEFRHLRYFVAVAEEENITRAAARLRISQPPLSRQIRDLEEYLGLALFHHGTRSIKLTDAGADFLTEARAILRQADHSVARLTAKHGGGNGGIHVGFAPSLTAKMLPLILKGFEKRMPGVPVRLHDATTEEMLDGVCKDRLHVALVIGTKIKPPKTLHVENLARFAACVALSKDHALASSTQIQLGQVAGQKLIAYSKSDYPEYHTWLREVFRSQPQRPKVIEEYDSSTSMIAAVKAGRGIALVQEGFEEMAGNKVVVRPLTADLPPFILAIAHKKNVRCTMTRSFLEAAREVG